MTNDRFRALMASDDHDLTEEEIKQGWHFCRELDGCLLKYENGQPEFCQCLKTTEQENN
jgi:hypothetical protein